MKKSLLLVCFCISVATQIAGAAEKLESYNIDTSSMSVSGFSAGAFMAVQMHVTYSKLFVGAGVIAGGPYWCAEDSVTTATTSCMTMPSMIIVGYLQQITRNTALTGFADPTSNMKDDKVYLFSGTVDTTIVPGVVQATEDYYKDFVNPSNIKTEYGVASQHGFPTVIYGGACDKTNYQTYINKCDYDGAYELLRHIYGSLRQPSYTTKTTVTGSIITFDQTEFFSGGLFSSYNGLANDGYLYVPKTCSDGSTKCKLHISFHGCEQGSEYIQDTYVKQTGYLEVADLNNIIVLFPQVKKDLIANPYGCFDWWGYTDSSYASNVGKQMMVFRKMVERLANV